MGNFEREIARCEAEIAFLKALPADTPDKAYLVALGTRDWLAEKRILEKSRSYSYTWRKRRPEDLARASYACARCYAEDQPMGLYSELERAHLNGDRTNDAPENVAVLCRTCHRRHDKDEWLALYRAYLERKRQERIDALDAARPILQFLQGVA